MPRAPAAPAGDKRPSSPAAPRDDCPDAEALAEELLWKDWAPEPAIAPAAPEVEASGIP